MARQAHVSDPFSGQRIVLIDRLTEPMNGSIYRLFMILCIKKAFVSSDDHVIDASMDCRKRGDGLPVSVSRRAPAGASGHGRVPLDAALGLARDSLGPGCWRLAPRFGTLPPEGRAAAMSVLLRLVAPSTALAPASAEIGRAGGHARRGPPGPRRHRGDDVAVIGFDDIPLAREITPSLTMVRIPLAEIGRGTGSSTSSRSSRSPAGAPDTGRSERRHRGRCRRPMDPRRPDSGRRAGRGPSASRRNTKRS